MKLLCCCVLILAVPSSARVKMVAAPVVYTNGNGGGQDELEVPAHADASKLFNAGGHVNEAWWVPYDNIADLAAIHRIEAVPEGDFVKLVVHGRANQPSGRIRLKLYAEISGIA